MDPHRIPEAIAYLVSFIGIGSFFVSQFIEANKA